jgi:hypothetical protein
MGLADRLAAAAKAAAEQKADRPKRRRKHSARRSCPNYGLIFLHRPRLAEAFQTCLEIDPQMLHKEALRRLIARLAVLGELDNEGRAIQLWAEDSGPLADLSDNEGQSLKPKAHQRIWAEARSVFAPETLEYQDEHPRPGKRPDRAWHENRLWRDLSLAWLAIAGHRLRHRFQLQATDPFRRAFRDAVSKALLTLGYVPASF